MIKTKQKNNSFKYVTLLDPSLQNHKLSAYKVDFDSTCLCTSVWSSKSGVWNHLNTNMLTVGTRYCLSVAVDSFLKFVVIF